MMVARGRVLVVAAGLGLVACSGLSLETASKSAEVADARSIVESVARGELAPIAARFAHELRGPDSAEKLAQLAAGFPKAAPARVRLVGYHSSRVAEVGGATTETYQITFEWTYPEADLLAQVLLRRVGGGDTEVAGLHVDYLPAPLDVLNAFTLRGRTAIHYAFLVVTLGTVGVSVTALVFWVRRRRLLHHRWRWLIAILVGLGEIELNWTTGGLDFRIATIQLLAASCGRAGEFAPWILSFSIPLGAVVFLWKLTSGQIAVVASPPAGPLPVSSTPQPESGENP